MYNVAVDYQGAGVRIDLATKAEEDRHGADWEWWLVEGKRRIGFPVQAKRGLAAGDTTHGPVRIGAELGEDPAPQSEPSRPAGLAPVPRSKGRAFFLPQGGPRSTHRAGRAQPFRDSTVRFSDCLGRTAALAHRTAITRLFAYPATSGGFTALSSGKFVWPGLRVNRGSIVKTSYLCNKINAIWRRGRDSNLLYSAWEGWLPFDFCSVVPALRARPRRRWNSGRCVRVLHRAELKSSLAHRG